MTDSIQSVAARHRAMLPAGAFARYFAGGPSLLVSATLAGPAVAAFGFDTILVAVEGGDVRFFRDARDGASDFAETSVLPSDLLMIIATTDHATALRKLWLDLGQEPPELVVVDDAVDATALILAKAKAEIACLSARCADLQRALVATRAEFEETRMAMQGVMRTLSHRYATKMNLVAVATPEPGCTVALAPEEALKRVYPVGTELVTCLALHVAKLDAADAVLKLTFLGAESRRTLGEWRRPGAALFAGWNIFDIPVPIAAVRESVAIEVALDGPADSTVSFSLSDDGCVTGEKQLAIRVWTADAGGRFPYAEHWVWHAGSAMRPAPGTVSLVPAAALTRIAARGGIEITREQISDGAGTQYLLRGGPALLCLCDLSIADVEGVCIELGRGFGDLGDTRFETLVQSGEHGFAGGWRSFAAADSTLRLGLSLPASLPDVVDVYLRIEDVERSAQALAGIAVRQIEIIAGVRATLDTGLREARIDPETLPPSRGNLAGPYFDSLKASNYNEANNYTLFEVVIAGLAIGDRMERQVKFKISKAHERLTIEFRQGSAWPKVFKEWPGREQDRFGDVFRISDNEQGLMIMGVVAPGEDAELLAALGALMPTIVASGIHAFPAAADHVPVWLDAARSFAAAAQRSFA